MRNEAESERVLAEVPECVTLRVSNGALTSKQLPARIKIFNWGDNPGTQGNYRVGEQTARLLAENQRTLGFERVAIDYNHASVPGSPEYAQGQVPPIFGYGRPRVVEGDGLWLEDVTWTPLGVEHARNFEDLSPAVHPKESGSEVSFVHSVALTTNGSTHELTFHSAKTHSTNAGEAGKRNQTMDENQIVLVADMAPVLGLAANASKADVLGKLAVLCAAIALEGRVAALEGAKPEGGASVAELATLSGRIQSLETALSAQATAVSERERGELVLLFARDGKVPMGPDGKAISAAELGKMDVGTLRILHANTPATVPLSARGRVAEGQRREDLTGLARAIAAHEREKN